MKTKFFIRRFCNGALLVITMIFMISTTGCLGFSTDVLRENITLEEAQSLVTFQVCIPAYIPLGIDPNPQIIYDADAANVPEETYIRLRYKRLDNQKRALEVYQVYTPSEEMKIEYPDSHFETLRGGATVILVWWLSSPKCLTMVETNRAVERTQLESNVFQTDQIVWWLYEITDPIEYRSTMTEWISDNVEYNILSLLPVDEIKKVTKSMMGCSIP